MLSWKIRAAAVASAVVILGATASISTAQAQPNTVHRTHFALAKLPKGVQARFARLTTQDLGTNVLLNSDLLIEVDNIASGNFAAEGHLSLHLKKGTTYTGSFVDNFGKGHKYKASATGVSTTEETGKYTIKSKNGTFSFTVVNGTQTDGSRPPKKYGKPSVTVFDGAVPHAYTKNPTLVGIIEGHQYGQYRAPIEGDLKLTTDALGWLVPHISHVSNSSFSYIHFPSSKPKTSNITAWGIYDPATGADDGMLQFSVKAHNSTFAIVAQEDDAESGGEFLNPLLGTATAGSGGSFFSSDFIAGIPLSS